MGMRHEDFEELFVDGWRDPTDGGRRGMYYLLFVFGVMAGFACLTFSIQSFAKPEILGGRTIEADRFLSSIFLGVGLGLSFGSLAFLRSEWKRVGRGGWTAETIVFGGFATSVALLVLSGKTLEASPAHTKNPLPATFVLFITSAAVFVLSLAVGLICAYWPKLTARKQRYNAVIDQRFGIDDVQNWIENPECPEADRLIPVVRIRLSDGETLTFRCDNSTYDLADPGSFGVATVVGKRLLTFSRKG